MSSGFVVNDAEVTGIDTSYDSGKTPLPTQSPFMGSCQVAGLHGLTLISCSMLRLDRPLRSRRI